MPEEFPDWLTPMAATLTQERFTGPEWVFERKLDGIRLLAFKNRRDVRLLSRNQLPQNLPSVASAVGGLPVKDVVLDGELTWRSGGVRYHVFDVLWLSGRSVTDLPLVERRKLLDELPLSSPLQRVAPIEEERPWERACREGWEGVIAKRRDSVYEHRRSRSWLKMKCEETRTFVVGGFTDPQGGRVGLGALLVGYFDGDDFVFAGKVGTGFDTKLLLHLRERLGALEVPAPAFTKGVGLPKVRQHWAQPEVVVEVSFIEWTVHGKLRHARLIRVRDDLKAKNVTRDVT